MSMEVEETMASERVYVDMKVATSEGSIHTYSRVDPIHEYELIPSEDFPVIRRNGHLIMSYQPTYWRAVESSISEPIFHSSPKVLSMEEQLLLKVAVLKKEIEFFHDKLNEETGRRIALEIGFSELRQHLGPLLAILRKDEF